MKQEFFQQGDIILRKIPGIKGKRIKTRYLEEGEATGHFHKVIEKDIEKVEMYEDNGQLFVKVIEPAKIAHDEHNTIVLPIGDYVMDKVREYDYFTEEVRQVQD